MTSGLVWCFFTWFRAAWILRNSLQCPNFLSNYVMMWSLISFFLWFKMRLKQWCVCDPRFAPWGPEIRNRNPCSSKPTWRPHQPPNVAGILNDTLGGSIGKALGSGWTANNFVDVCCAWWECAITTYVNMNMFWICKCGKIIVELHTASAVWANQFVLRCQGFFMSPTIGIAKCLMKHPRGSCRWTMEWDPEGWMRLLLGKLIESWKKLQFTSFYVVCLFICFFQFSI